ncbi:MAG: hypothetical protein AAF206_10880 [Bacteroidota bacterium]
MDLRSAFQRIGSYLGKKRANVQVRPANPLNDGNLPILLIVNAQAEETDLQLGCVYVKIRAVEKINHSGVGGQDTANNPHALTTAQTWAYQQRIDGPQVLEAYESAEWTTEIELPEQVYGTYRGKNAFHIWEVKAGLQLDGKNAESNWMEIDIRK